MLKEKTVADVATLERSPAKPRIAATIEDMLARHVPTEVICRVAGGATNLHRIIETYLRPPPPSPRAAPIKPVPRRRVTGTTTREQQRAVRRAEAEQLGLDNARRLRRVGAVVCDAFAISPDALAGRNGSHELVQARGAFCLLAEAHIVTCGKGLITSYILRDHSTLRHYRRWHAAWMREPAYSEMYRMADAALTES